MASYTDLVRTNKKFVKNAIIKIGSDYFGMRQPDSGLVLTDPKIKMISSLVLNPVVIDIKKVSTTVASFTFKLVDKDNFITGLVLGNGAGLIGQEVTIWLGRVQSHARDEAMDFSEYYQLPITQIKKIDHGENAYTFTSNDEAARMAKPIFDAQSALAVDILAATTTLTMRDSIESFPAAGMIHLENEFIAYASKNDSTKEFLGCTRGQLDSVAADHSANEICYESQTITDNPLNIILRILTSGGGGGSYDDLQTGLAISENLIDVAGIETIRDANFAAIEIKLQLSNIDSALKLIENEILQPYNLRFSYSLDSKLTLAVLDQAVFTPDIDVIDHDTIRDFPKWTVDDSKIVNQLKINWDYDEVSKTYLKYDNPTDAASIALYGKRTPITFNFKGIKDDLDGQTMVDDFARVLFARLSVPTPEVEIKTQMDKSLLNIGDKNYVESNKIPASDGTLNFASDMEIVQKSVNFITDEVSLKLAFTSFTKFRSAFIAPSDLIIGAASQKRISIASGRSTKYRVGMKMRLWDEVNKVYLADAVNTIVEIGSGGGGEFLLEQGGAFLLEQGGSFLLEQSSDEYIIFENNWTTPLTYPNNYRVRFADYDDVTSSQKRYGFISDNGANFADSKPTYKVTY